MLMEKKNILKEESKGEIKLSSKKKKAEAEKE